MSVDPPFSVYQDQLTALSHGLALWDPKPQKCIYDNVSIGDVGYMQDGMFIRMFNVTLPCDHPSNLKLGKPEYYDPLDCGPFTNVHEVPLKTQEHISRYVSVETNDSNTQAKVSDNRVESVTYNCRGQGALLLLPHGSRRADIIRTKVFEDYMRDHVDRWFNWAQKCGLGVERMEDLILVSGCTLVNSWAAAAFVDNNPDSEAEISLGCKLLSSLSNVGASFGWRNVRGHVSYNNSRFDPQNPFTMADQCVFIRGFRAKRILFWTRRMRAAMEPRPDDPDNHWEDEIQVSRVPGTSKYRDPLVGVLDYIEEKCQMENVEEGILAIAHHDDLQFIEDVETPTADAIQEYLLGKQIPLLVENGAAILQDATDNEPPVSDERKAVFYAIAELNGEPVPIVIHPVLAKYYIKLKMNDSTWPDHDYSLSKVDMNSPAVHPPMLSLKLESHQGYPQLITVEANDTRGVGVTVQEVLRTIHEDLRMPFPRRELSVLGADQRAMVNAAFLERCKSGEELSKGPRRIDHLRGRDRLQILPKYGSDGSVLIPASRTAEALGESSVAGPSRIPIR